MKLLWKSLMYSLLSPKFLFYLKKCICECLNPCKVFNDLTQEPCLNCVKALASSVSYTNFIWFYSSCLQAVRLWNVSG